MGFDHSKLRGRIVEKYGTESNFAEKWGKSKQTLSLKLCGKVAITQDDIAEWCELLDIKVADAGPYFFKRLS